MITSIIDNGNGFSEESLNKVFDLFHTDDSMISDQDYGLGLAAVKLIMDAHNGKIEVKNKPDGGAKVDLFFERKG